MNRAEKLLFAMHRANQELGVPTNDYPAPVANASRILTEAIGQDALDEAEGVHQQGEDA